MLGINYSTEMGELQIQDDDLDWITLHCPAWNLLDVLALYVPTGADAGNTKIPGADGRRANAYTISESHYMLPMVVTGKVDRDGTPYANYQQGLQHNIAFLYGRLVQPPAAGPTREAQLLMPDGEVRTAEVQVLSITPGVTIQTQTRATLELVIPSGYFAPLGS